jgi:electron transport complex protein RnfE
VFASRNNVSASFVDGITMGSGFALLLCSIGFFRELIGHGTIFSRLDMLFGGEPMSGIVVADGGFLLAILPPGAFISLALFVAAKNVLDRRRNRSHQPAAIRFAR